MSNVLLSQTKKVALVIGATGLVGNYLVQELLNDECYQKIIVVTRAKPSQSDHHKMNWVEISPEATSVPDDQHHKPIELAAIFEQRFSEILPSGNDIFSCLGTTKKKAGSLQKMYQIDYSLNVGIAKAALKKGFSQYLLVSSYGASPLAINAFLKLKGRVEVAIRTLPFWAIHIFQPGLIDGHREETRPLEEIGLAITKSIQLIVPKAFSNSGPVHGQMVAMAMKNVAQFTTGGVFHYQNSDIRTLIDPQLLINESIS